jgi:molecular chaperone DnaJ
MALPISVFQAMLGAELDVTTILDESKTVRVGAGSQPGDVLRLRGAGMPQVDSHRRGDLHVHLRVIVPERLSSEQQQLIEEAARLGDEVVDGSQEGFFERLKRALGNED